MRERQGCRSASIQGETGDVGETHFCGLRAKRVDGAPTRGELYLPRSVSLEPWSALPPSFGFQHATEGE